MMANILPEISDFIGDDHPFDFARPALGKPGPTPWNITGRAPEILLQMLDKLGPDYVISDNIAVHRTAVVETGAVMKGPAIIGPDAFIAAYAYLRGGVYVGSGAIIGPVCELKTVFMMDGAKVAHLSFVGDSIIGPRVNIEAGAMVANYRNEHDGGEIRIGWAGTVIHTGVTKFGALIGHDCKIGANAVIAPGAILPPHDIIPRLALIDQQI